MGAFFFVNMAVTSVKRKVKVSKNKKKSWNKFCDVKDVEEFLEEKRFNERIGGAVSEKTNEELFFVHTETGESAKSKVLNKPLKCHQNIGAYSKVLPPVNADVNRYPKRIKNVLQKSLERKCKKLAVQASRNKQADKGSQADHFTSNLRDLWADENGNDADEMKELITFRDEYTKKRTPNVPSHRYQKPSLLPAVELPHAGSSYNPSHEDHQALLKEAVNVEETRLKEELHLKRVLDDMFPSKAEAPTKESILEEMSQGLFEDMADDDESESFNNFMLRNPPVTAEDRLPKSRKKRRKEMKEEAKKRAVEKLNKQRLHEIYRLPSIKHEIKKEKEISEQKQDKRLQRKVEKMYNPKTLSKHKYEAPDIEVNLTEDLTNSLRTLKAEGNILEDRYKSLQRRNLIEPRIRQKMKRKYKLKRQVKRSHRDFK